MAPNTNVEIYQRLIEAFNRDGVDGVLPFFADDVEVYDPDVPPGSYRGPDAVKHFVQLTTSGFEDVEIIDFRLLPAGDRVVALMHTRGKGELVDLVVESRTAHTITFRDGKVGYWRAYDDQVEALTDVGLDPSLASPGTRAPS